MNETYVKEPESLRLELSKAREDLELCKAVSNPLMEVILEDLAENDVDPSDVFRSAEEEE